VGWSERGNKQNFILSPEQFSKNQVFFHPRNGILTLESVAVSLPLRPPCPPRPFPPYFHESSRVYFIRNFNLQGLHQWVQSSNFIIALTTLTEVLQWPVVSIIWCSTIWRTKVTLTVHNTPVKILAMGFFLRHDLYNIALDSSSHHKTVIYLP
jgi:hypothetical protein